MEFIERTSEECHGIIKDHRETYTVHVTTVTERLESSPNNLGWRAHVSLLAPSTAVEKWGFNSGWLFATQTDAMNWGYWMAATWVEDHEHNES